MDTEVLSSSSKVAIFQEKGMIDVIVSEAHIKEFIETLAHDLVLEVRSFDPTHVHLFGCLSRGLLLGDQVSVRVWKIN